MVINERLAKKKPMVSISMLTYNHEKYIEQAIQSVVMQKTNFEYHLIIGEDCSNDMTRKIVIDYARRYPEKIIAILHDKNIGMKKNVLAIRRFLNGKYIAVLEGDDYWLDANKLQMQVDFLETHVSYCGVCHSHKDVDENGNEITGIKAIELNSGYTKKNIYNLEEVGKCYLAGHTSSLLYRNIFYILDRKQVEIYDKCDVVGDKKLNLVLANFGGIYKIPQCMSAYRHHLGAWTDQKFVGGLAYYSYRSIDKLKNMGRDLFNIEINFEDGILRSWYGVCVECLKNRKFENFKIVWEVLKDGNKFNKIFYLFSHTVSFLKRRKLGG